MQTIKEKLASWIFSHRKSFVVLFIAVTLVMLYFALDTQVDAGFNKRLPLKHEYIQTFLKYQDQFGGANKVLIAMTVDEGDIFTKDYLELLEELTNAVYNVPGIDRSRVSSLWTPNTRFIEIVEDGFAGGNVIPANFAGTPEDLQRVRENTIKSGKVGQLVATDFSGALVSGELQDINPATGEQLDYIQVADYLETEIRDKFEQQGKDLGIKIHIIGFAKVIGDVSEGVVNVMIFFLISFVLTGLAVYYYSQSFRLTLLPLITSVVAVTWQLGLLRLFGYGIDPMSILVPFLVFAIGVSHGVQMVRTYRAEIFSGETPEAAGRTSFIQLLVPGGAALVTDTIGFVTILLIKIPMIQELAIAASLGVAAILFTNLLFLPVLLSFVHLKDWYQKRIQKRRKFTDRMWAPISKISQPVPSIIIIAIAILLGFLGFDKARQVQIGDLHQGVPELRPTSRYNEDTAVITEHFSIGVDIVTVIVETVPDGVIEYEIMELVDRFHWHMRNVEGVQSVISLPGYAKVLNAGWNEGNPKWQVLPKHPAVMAQALSLIPTSSGLLNSDGSVMPVMIFLKDHKADTIERVIQAVKNFRTENPSERVNFLLATGNVGVMGSQNEVVKAAQFPILMYVFSAVILLCLLAFRSWKAAVCIVVPLALVSVLAYALMYYMEIGLKSNTLPVVALGVGVGVDYGIYLFSRLQICLKSGMLFEEALNDAFRRTGSAVLFTGITLGFGVSTWIFSSLKFQADMGILLTFMFLLNMTGAIFLLPALARWVYPHHRMVNAEN